MQQLEQLPDAMWVQWLALPLAVALLVSSARIQGAFWFGILWATLHAQAELAQLSQAWRFTGDQVVVGRVTSIVRSFNAHRSFDLRVGRILRAGVAVDTGMTVRLRWYGGGAELIPGDCVRLTARLRPVRAYFNPGGRDRARGLLRRGVHGAGYVRSAKAVPARCTDGVATRARGALAYSRGWLDARLSPVLESVPRGQLIRALVLGLRDGVSGTEREIMLHTGTAHLLAISGLHIGLAAGGVHALVMFGWRRTGNLQSRLTAPIAAAVTGTLVATVYALLSGFGIPAQRALVMLCVWLLVTSLRSRTGAAELLSLAAVAVLLYDPAAVADAGFWLSFGAVGMLALALQQRRTGFAVGLLHAQFAASVGLGPLTLMWFGTVPLLGWVANLAAVPIVGLFVVPTALFGTVVAAVAQVPGGWLLHIAGTLIDWLWGFLEWLAAPGWVFENQAPLDLASLGLAWLGSAVVLSRLPGRWIGFALWLPAVFGSQLSPHTHIPRGQFEVNVYDVGQGLAVGVRTTHHTLLYDTGAGGARWSVAAGTVIPAMAAAGMRRLDVLLVSHPDQDHAGGTGAIVRALRPTRRIGDAGVYASPGGAMQFEPCNAPQRWTWDGVEFEILHPRPRSRGSRNNRSCVLRVTGDEVTMLLPGDIESSAEKRLLSGAVRLDADILIAPHHGSGSSSSPGFVFAVHPELVVFSAGWMNRFGQPHASVLRRFGRIGASLYNTATDGAIRIRSGPGGISVQTSAPSLQRYWHVTRARGGWSREAEGR
ncbi:MAG: DNA internalization-related competence protein ComEC/Rec2 [Pseudomonadota bacterium]